MNHTQHVASSACPTAAFPGCLSCPGAVQGQSMQFSAQAGAPRCRRAGRQNLLLVGRTPAHAPGLPPCLSSTAGGARCRSSAGAAPGRGERERERPAHASPARDHVSSSGSTVLFEWWQLGRSTVGRKPGAVGIVGKDGVMQGPST